MHTEKNKIVAKSTPGNFEKEKLGVKANTVREIPEWEESDMFSDFLEKFRREEQLQIEIHCTDTTQGYFRRDVKDVTHFKENIYIISF